MKPERAFGRSWRSGDGGNGEHTRFIKFVDGTAGNGAGGFKITGILLLFLLADDEMDNWEDKAP